MRAPIVNGVRLGLGVAIIGTLLAETKLSNRGIGYLVIQAYALFDMPRMYALLIVLFVLAIGANALIGRLRRGLRRRAPRDQDAGTMSAARYMSGARVVKLVDTRDLKSAGARRHAGSIPALGTRTCATRHEYSRFGAAPLSRGRASDNCLKHHCSLNRLGDACPPEAPHVRQPRADRGVSRFSAARA